MWLLKFVAGLGLLPCCYIMTRTLFDLLLTMRPDGYQAVSSSFLGLIIGFCLWLFLFFCAPRPMRTYVLGHELTHALWAWIMGAQVKNVRVTKTGGSVTVSKTNFLITLAPYFFPFYTLCVIGVHFIIEIFYDQEIYAPFWLGLVGLTWGFHLTFTLSMLKQHQPDIHEHGSLFSYSFIYLMNILGICLWVVFIAQPTLETLVDRVATNSQTTWQTVCEGKQRLRKFK